MTRWQRATLAGILAAAACLGAAAWSYSRQQAFQREELAVETRLAAHQFATRIRNGLEKHVIAMGQMATFFENSQAVTEKEFARFARATMGRTPQCLRLVVTDAAHVIRWVYPPGPNAALIAFDVKTHHPGLETLERARQTHEAAISPPVRLIASRQRGFILATPIYRRSGFLGNVVCTFENAAFFASVTLPESLARYEQMATVAGQPIYASQSFDPLEATIAPVTADFTIAATPWEVSAMPRVPVVEERLASGTAAFWTLATLLALLVGGVAGLGTYEAAAIALRLRSQGAALQQTREQLEGATRRLFQAEKMTALGELVAGVAHEINNPLSTIMGYCQLLGMKDPPPDTKKRLDIMYAEADRMTKIVKNLLTFARKHAPERQYLDLNGLIDKTLELKAYHFNVNQIAVEKDLAPELPMTMLDLHQIQQVFLNLLNNAEQALVEAGRPGAIRLSTRLVDGRIEARVSDDGPGIPMEIQSRVFEPFFTTKKDGRGTGLGLSLCYGIVHEHGGSITVESKPGAGATFIIVLPVLGEAPAPRSADPEALPRVPERLCVLVIDDEPSVQSFLRDLLSGRGHRVEIASDVPEALVKIGADGHDVIISDIKMPHGTGRDVYRAALDRDPDLARRIIFTTGDSGSPETQRFLEEISNQVVLKPFTIEQIETAIARASRN